ncbi:MAG TPA: hypothetical protein VK812_08215 [Candidatus Binatus sp.]|nr:hypothetical protein [Candidatus Binatus sp.]
MKSSANTIRRWALVSVLALGASLSAWGQESSLGDVARKTRQERATTGHVRAKKSATEDDDGPDGGGVWRLRLCTLQPCYELSITLPKNPKWSRAEQEPRPVSIPLSGHEKDASRAIRVYAAQSTDLKYTADSFKREFLQGWFARPEYFGQEAHVALDEHVRIDWSNGLITHFIITGPALKYRGLSVVAGSPYGNFAFACVYREEDAAVGDSVCDAIIKSAQYQEIQPSSVRRTYPDPNDDPADDPPRDDPE